MPDSGRPGILLDQNVPYGVTRWLDHVFQGTCHVVHVYDVGLASATDEQDFRWAQAERCIIITFDEDFADQRHFPVGEHNGIIRLRVEPTTEQVTCAVLGRLFADFAVDQLAGKLVIVDETRVRIRP